MLFIKAAVVLCSLGIVNCALIKEIAAENLMISNAIHQIVTEICVKTSCNSGFSVILTSVDDYINDITLDVISKIKAPILVERKVTILKNRQRFLVLVFIDDMAGFMRFYDQLKMENFFFSGIYVIIYPDGRSGDMNEMFTLLWNKFVSNVNIITQTSGLIEMFTFMPYKKLDKCGDATNIKINEFNGEAMSWLENQDFFPKKFKDLHGCSIKAGLFNIPPAIIVHNTTNGTVHLSGFDVDIFNELLGSIKAVVNYTVYPINTGKIFPNGTGSGLLGRTISGDVDVSLRCYSNQMDRRKILTDSVSYYSDKLMLIMPLPSELNPLLKLVRPLTIEVWCALLAVVVIASVVIHTIKLIPSVFYRRIIGKRIRNEFMSLLIGFLGLSQHDLPEKNFPRFLLMMFLIFCLIIRSLYSGSLFNMLKSDIRSRELVSIRDFYEAGFDFYLYETLSQRLDYPEINARRKIVDISELDHYSLKTLNPDFKGVVFQYLTNALHSNQLNFKQFTYKICKESLMTNHLIFYFRKNFYLVHEVNERIDIFKAGGITNYFIARYADEKYRKIEIASDGPSKLSLTHFIGMFELWLFGLFVAFILFLAEHILHKLKRVNKREKNHI